MRFTRITTGVAMAVALAVGSLTAASAYATTPAAHTTQTVSAPTSVSWTDVGLYNRYLQNKCLDADSNTWYNDGGIVQVWTCNYQQNQHWWMSYPGTYNTTIQTPGPPQGPAKCLDAWPVAGAPGGYRISVWSCNGGDQQRWDTSGHSLRNLMWNKCLDIDTTADYNGAPVTLRDCNGAAGQAWL